MIPAFPVYLFDVDGTLVDSAPDICGAVRQTLKGTGAREVDEAYLCSYIGRHLYDLWDDLLPDCPPDRKDQLLANYRTIYAGRQHGSTKLYPGVAETLARLRGRKSTATTKGTPTVRIVLEMFGLLGYFDHVQGTDGFPAKPAPDVIQRSLEALQARPEDVLMVGDATTDMAAGRAAGVRICAVRYGYGNHQEMARYEPDFWIDSLSELAVES
ncbi:MAG TPA: HAD-IA family hydrolase [Bryobacteraceae bacterium]|nr:HAD-IA family hydrolase [Bryobacteraceae bacterium]